MGKKLKFIVAVGFLGACLLLLPGATHIVEQTVKYVDGVLLDLAGITNGQVLLYDGTKIVGSTVGTNSIKPGNTKITSASVLTINDGCSAGDPCNIRVGSTTYSFTGSATATITAGSGSGTAKVFVSSTGVITVQHPTAASLTLTCTNCTATQVTTPAFPAGSVPLYDVTITTGAWTVVSDLRSFIGGGGGSSGCGLPTCLDPPPTSGWTDVNFAGTTTVESTDNYQILKETAQSTNIRGRFRAAPSAPFTCAADFALTTNAYSQEIWFGMAQRESGTGEIAIFLTRSSGNGHLVTVNQPNNPSFTAVTGDGAIATPPYRGTVTRWATRDDSTNRQFGNIDLAWNFLVGVSGAATQGRTVTLTADQVGYVIWNNAISGSELNLGVTGWECR